MILDSEFLGGATETYVERLTRLRVGLARLRRFHGNAVAGLDHMRSLDPELVPAPLINIFIGPILDELDLPLGLGRVFTSECSALARSVEMLNKRLLATHDLCLSELCTENGSVGLEEFRKLEGAFLSPISILDFLLAECARTATTQRKRRPR